MKSFITTIILLFLVACTQEQAPLCEYELHQAANEIWMIHVDDDSIALDYPYTSPDLLPLVNDLNDWLDSNDTDQSGVMINVDGNRVIHLHIWSTHHFDSVRFSNTPGGAFPFFQPFESSCN